jgi:2-dehydropantoate 2-reductase
MKVCIVGAGAIGGLFTGWLGTRLPPGEVHLSVYARGATLQALRRDGLSLASGGDTLRVNVAASDRATDLGPQDLVIVAVKGPALEAVAPAVRSLLAPQGVALVAMNGVPWWFFHGLGGVGAGWSLRSVDPRGAIEAAIPVRQVLGCVVHTSCSTEAPAQVRHIGGDGLIVGEPAGGGSARSAQVAALLQRAGFSVTLSPRIQRDIWFKLWGNMTMNPVSALTGATCDRILDDDLLRGFCSAAMREAQLIGKRIGCEIDQTPEERHALTRKLGAFRTSMLQDVDAGRPIETEALVGAVHEIGRRLNLATPNIDALYGLLRVMAAARGL